MKYEDKKLLFIIGGTLVAIGGIAYYFYMQGKKQTTIAPLPPDDSVPGPGGQSGSVQQSVLTAIAAALYNDMKGLNLIGHDPVPYQDAVNLSDIDFVRLYNTFNTKYQQATGETLTGWFNNEEYLIWGDEEQSVYYAFQQKLNKLNLK
jgi:hypothetical protein